LGLHGFLGVILLLGNTVRTCIKTKGIGEQWRLVPYLSDFKGSFFKNTHSDFIEQVYGRSRRITDKNPGVMIPHGTRQQLEKLQ
jgi:hypothetical protein